jgi:hypothetical protein
MAASNKQIDSWVSNGHYLIAFLFCAAQFLLLKGAPMLWKKHVEAQKAVIDAERANTKLTRDAEFKEVNHRIDMLESSYKAEFKHVIDKIDSVDGKITNFAKKFDEVIIALIKKG